MNILAKMTMGKAGFLSLVLYSLLSSSSCGRESISIEGNKEFPDNIGSWWKYTVSDAGDDLPDTVIIRVGKVKWIKGIS